MNWFHETVLVWRQAWPATIDEAALLEARDRAQLALLADRPPPGC